MAVRKKTSIYQIKITLIGSKPPIWRRIVVPSNMTLPRLHDALQIIMGWKGYHLHQFIVGTESHGIPDPDFPTEVKNEARAKVRGILSAEGDSVVYEYDFGDGWKHRLVLEKCLPYDKDEPLPRCLDGKRACPPEDCGGIGGFEHLLEAISDPKHPEHDDRKRWIGGEFDPAHPGLSVVNFNLGRWFGKRA